MIYSEAYRNFINLWRTIDNAELVADPDKHQAFYFDFLFRLILSVSKNLKHEDMQKVKTIATKFYELPLPDIEVSIESLKKHYPT